MNYGEELGYWYLRLNGCFPIVNFVLHGGSLLEYTSDCDLLAIRPPNVSEEIDGRLAEWDPVLSKLFDDRRTLGLICEVKTGRYELKKLFPAPNLAYAINRLGLLADNSKLMEALSTRAVVEAEKDIRIAKLLFARDPVKDQRFVCITFYEVRDFFQRRFRAHKNAKFRDRLFFPSELIQETIDQLLAEEKR